MVQMILSKMTAVNGEKFDIFCELLEYSRGLYALIMIPVYVDGSSA
jgi:hypothetical protein